MAEFDEEGLRRMTPMISKHVFLRFIPGTGAGSVGSFTGILAGFFYLYVLVVVVRMGTFVRLLESPSKSDILDAALIVLGLAAFYTGSIVPNLIRGRSSGKVFDERVRRFRTNTLAVAGMVVFLSFVGVSLLAPLLAPYHPSVQNEPAMERYQPPSMSHPMGTDRFGRDILSRVVYGARVSLSVGVAVVILVSIFGMFFGALSAYVGGWLDDAAMRIVDGLLSFPRLVLLLTLVAFFANSFWLVVLVLSATGWMGVARLVRADVLSLKERDFVQAAVATGAGHARVIWRHLIPNALGPVIVTATLRIALIILLESYLSFLGLGVQPPTPSWGGMVYEGREVLLSAWWVSAFPGLAIVAAVVSCNLVGDGLRDAMDVKMG
jgi:peptide/nickel transport system permease protein